ncbi:unnamed protein product [Heterosigma akashiwo]|uniref:IMS import disulfide relay-system CHCH-CHCH-like Cx9C domain-containing protein n=1 Tax=Heterosigma akashiwo TaxID=2829 RepID=A0A6V2SIE8_HETAK|mmetsp:Transcript_11591/g.18556  ORF Transcript_11591/g.18556 Transcript_11591/m.18556 type:complete len:101 (-) Transcript_11591:296-598(-)
MASTTAPTSDILWAASKLIGSECAVENKKFYECKLKDKNPAACVGEGAIVQSCVFSLLKKVDSKCPEQFKAFNACLDRKSGAFGDCKDLQNALDSCFYGK